MPSPVLDRFLRYVTYDTQSREGASTYPSTPSQLVLLRDLVAELRAMGVTDAAMDEHGYVMATIPATTSKPDVPVIGFIAHVDTSPEMSGAGVKPIVHRAYDGRDLVLPDDPDSRAARGGRALPRRVPRPRHRHRVGHDAARRRQQERRRRDHDRGRTADGASRDSARRHPHRVHAGRGGRQRARSSSTWPGSARATPTRWTAARAANWSSRASRPTRSPSPSAASTPIRVTRRAAW